MTTISLDVPANTATTIKKIGDQLPLVIELGMSRIAPVSTQAYMEAVALFTQNPAPEKIANFRFSENIEKRIDELVTGNDNDDLSKAEQVELQRLMQLEAQLQLVKAKAIATLQKLA